jgi:hypothetical protein
MIEHDVNSAHLGACRIANVADMPFLETGNMLLAFVFRQI